MKFAILFLCLALAGFILSVFSLAPSLPEQIATHFNANGEADGWMTRTQHVTYFSLVGFGLPLFLMGMCYATRYLPATALNVPNAAYWRSKENYLRACQILFEWSVWLSVATLIWLAMLHYQLIDANRTQPPVLNTQNLIAITALYLGFLLIAVVGLLAKYRTIPTK